MKNFVQAGVILTLAAPSGGVTSGTGVKIGSIIGIPAKTVAEGVDVAIKTDGVFEHAKTSAQAWTVGATVYWDDTNKVFTTTSSGNTKAGVAVAAAANPSATGFVKLIATI